MQVSFATFSLDEAGFLRVSGGVLSIKIKSGKEGTVLALLKDQGGGAPEGPPPGPWSAAQKASDCTKESFQRNGTSHPESLGGVSWGAKWPSWFVWRSLCCLLSEGVEGPSVMAVLHVLASEGRGGIVAPGQCLSSATPWL